MYRNQDPHQYTYFLESENLDLRSRSSRSSRTRGPSVYYPDLREDIPCSDNIKRYLMKRTTSSSRSRASPKSGLMSGSFSSLDAFSSLKSPKKVSSKLWPFSGIFQKTKSRRRGVVLPPKLPEDSRPPNVSAREFNNMEERSRYDITRLNWYETIQDSCHCDGANLFMSAPRARPIKPGPFYDDDNTDNEDNFSSAIKYPGRDNDKYKVIYNERYCGVHYKETLQREVKNSRYRRRTVIGDESIDSIDSDSQEMEPHLIAQTMRRNTIANPQTREIPPRYIRVPGHGQSPPIFISAATTLGGLPEPQTSSSDRGLNFCSRASHVATSLCGLPHPPSSTSDTVTGFSSRSSNTPKPPDRREKKSLKRTKSESTAGCGANQSDLREGSTEQLDEMLALRFGRATTVTETQTDEMLALRFDRATTVTETQLDEMLALRFGRAITVTETVAPGCVRPRSVRYKRSQSEIAVQGQYPELTVHARTKSVSETLFHKSREEISNNVEPFNHNFDEAREKCEANEDVLQLEPSQIDTVYQTHVTNSLDDGDSLQMSNDLVKTLFDFEEPEPLTDAANNATTNVTLTERTENSIEQSNDLVRTLFSDLDLPDTPPDTSSPYESPMSDSSLSPRSPSSDNDSLVHDIIQHYRYPEICTLGSETMPERPSFSWSSSYIEGCVDQSSDDCIYQDNSLASSLPGIKVL